MPCRNCIGANLLSDGEQLIKEAQRDLKTDNDPGSAALDRFKRSAVDTCVWCCLDPPRGKQLLCQTCNVYRRTYDRPPTQKAVDRRRNKRIEAEADRR